MNPDLSISTERVDDIPVLLAFQEQMQVGRLLDEHFPTHGNWQGLSLGQLAVRWLTHILSQADHRMNHVQTWAEQRLETLQQYTDQPLTALDFSDDRLSAVLDYLSDDQAWDQFEAALSQNLLRVYELPRTTVRLDSTSASGYWQLTPDGLFQLGHSKDHRPDLPQVKIQLAALDPLGLPLATLIVAGQRADDPLYPPSIERARAGLGRRGLLYVGDCKMAALATRALLHAGGDFYLMPLSAKQLSADELAAALQPVWNGQQPLTPISRELADGTSQVIAEGFERSVAVAALHTGQSLRWHERHLLIRSQRQAQAAEAAVRTRLVRAQADMAELMVRRRGKRRLTRLPELRAAVESIVEHYQVPGLLDLHYAQTIQRRARRRYGQRPARLLTERTPTVQAQINEAALQVHLRPLGWRVYASNAPDARLSLNDSVLTYRHEYLIEHDFSRFKGQPLSLTPTYLQRADHLKGLIRLLTIGLRVLTLLEFVVRRRLATAQSTLAGLAAGNPKRTTARPSAEHLLEAFKDITLTIIHDGVHVRRHLPPLSQLQERILTLLDLSPTLYTNLSFDSS